MLLISIRVVKGTGSLYTFTPESTKYEIRSPHYLPYQESMVLLEPRN